TIASGLSGSFDEISRLVEYEPGVSPLVVKSTLTTASWLAPRVSAVGDSLTQGASGFSAIVNMRGGRVPPWFRMEKVFELNCVSSNVSLTAVVLTRMSGGASGSTYVKGEVYAVKGVVRWSPHRG